MSDLRILLTNDDGIDSPGLTSLYDELSTIADVTAVAPATNQSGVGRSRTGIGHGEPTVTIEEHELGYAIGGTPADCTAVGLRELCNPDALDVVVSGCNVGPNVGSYIMGHSGTVGAAVEAAFLGVPSIAVSAYDYERFFPNTNDYSAPAVATRRIVTEAVEHNLFSTVDLLNLNTRVDTETTLRSTQPLADYDTAIEANGDGVGDFTNTYWAAKPVGPDGLPELDTYKNVYPEWSDRAAVVDGVSSVTPLRLPQIPADGKTIADVVTAYNNAI